LPAALLQRKAVVYVRLSTAYQVQTNLESQRRQYELVEKARHQRFAKVEVIDEDLGRSADGAVSPPGFDRLVADLCAGEVGAVVCFDASHLARNGRDGITCGRDIVDQEVEGIQIGDGVDSDDTLAPDPIGQEVLGRREEEGSGVRGPRLGGSLKDARVRFLSKITQFVRVQTPTAAKKANEPLFVGEDLLLEPGLEGLIHCTPSVARFERAGRQGRENGVWLVIGNVHRSVSDRTSGSA
jgi:Resolvase, N terminal domain